MSVSVCGLSQQYLPCIVCVSVSCVWSVTGVPAMYCLCVCVCVWSVSRSTCHVLSVSVCGLCKEYLPCIVYWRQLLLHHTTLLLSLSRNWTGSRYTNLYLYIKSYNGHLLCLESWALIHRYCLKIYPKMCHNIIVRQKL